MESKGYICPQCKMIYSSLDVSRLLNVRTGSFDCEVCPDSELQSYDPMHSNSNSNSNKAANGPHELHSRLMEQTRLIVELLKLADDITIPAFVPSAWLEKNASKYSLLATEGNEEDGGPQLAIAGANSVETKINVSVELADEESLRAATASVSTPLPEWHMYSTITGEAIRQNNVNVNETVRASNDSKDVIDITGTDDQDDIVSYYTQITHDTQETEQEQEPSLKMPKLQDASVNIKSESTESASSTVVFVNGKPIPLDQLTEDDKDKMTEEEYAQYYEIYMSTIQ